MAMNTFATNNELAIMQKRNELDLMNNDTYLRLVLEFSSSMELIKTIILLSKYHNNYIHSNKYSHHLINHILQREFGCVITNNTHSSNPLTAIQTMHNYWDDTKVKSNLNFIQRIMKHYKQWTVHGLLHFMTKICAKKHISLCELSFNLISEQFERIQIHQQHNQHFMHLLWHKTIETITINTNNHSDIDDDNWMIDADGDTDNKNEENQLKQLCLIQPELEKYLQILYYMNRNAGYEMQQEDIFTFYRIFEIVNGNIKHKMLEMLVTEDTVMTEIFTFLIDILEGQRPLAIDNLYDDFNRQWPIWSKPFINSLLPAVVKYAIMYAQLDNKYIDNMDNISIDGDTVTRRWSMSDICIEIADIIGQYKLYEIFLELLNNNNGDWKYYESILFCIGTHTKVTCIDSNDIKIKQQHPLYQIFVKIIDLKVMDNIRVRNRGIYLFGHHCVFLDANDYILKLYFDKFIIGTLCNDKWCSQTKTFAANALKRFCESFSGKEIPLVIMQSIYNIYINGFKNINKCINIKQEILIIIGLTTIIIGFDDLNEIENGIDYMIQMPHKYLCMLTGDDMDEKKQDIDIDVENKNYEMKIVQTMKRLSTIFKYFKLDCDSNGLPLKALLKIWPQILYLLEHKTNEDDIMEYSIRCLKHVIRECSNEYKQCSLFLSFFEKIIYLYINKSQRSSFLYIMSIYLDEYNTNQCILRLFSSSMYEITLTTFKVASTEQLFVKHHEMIEDFYEMVKVYLRTRKKHIFEHNMYCIKWIFEMGINGLLLTNVNAHIAIITFYNQFFDNQNNNCKHFVDNIYFKYGELLINKILFFLVFNLNKKKTTKI
eukprot:396873_1